MEPKQKFKICLTMAGAVSAGAYTAGVMDYLLETLELWEKAKLKNRQLGKDHPLYDHSVPMHEVELDVMSGASAGGITGTLTMLNLIDNDYSPVNKDNPQGKNNRYYQSWVVMGDDNKSNTFEKLLSNGDLEKLGKDDKPKALLNSEPIDGIVDRAIRVDNPRSYPAYASDSLDLVMTTTNLRGINFRVDFTGNDKSAPIITSHGGFFRYKLENDKYKKGIPDGEDLYYVLDLKEQKHREYLKTATLSTAAFPIGLQSREVAISQEYIKRYPKYLFGKREGIHPIIQDGPIYKFNSIDGGLINNEPFGIALRVMNEKYAEQPVGDRYAVIMINPFPNKDNEIEDKNPTPDMISVAKGMFKSLRNQVMFNQDGILDAIKPSIRTHFLIEPVRKEKVNGEMKRAKNDLAAAPFSGFAGFIDKSFRHHDYHLGRHNCQSFLRYYFGIEQKDILHKLGEESDAKAFDRFFIYESQFDTNSTKIYPIIPDMRVTKARVNQVDKDTYGIDANLAYPEYPHISQKAFEDKYRKAIKLRVQKVGNHLISGFRFSLLNRLFIRNIVSKKIESLILEELADADLLK
jgi:hypothetical protein